MKILNKFKIFKYHQIRKFCNIIDLRKLDFLSAEKISEQRHLAEIIIYACPYSHYYYYYSVPIYLSNTSVIFSIFVSHLSYLSFASDLTPFTICQRKYSKKSS